MKEHSSLPGTAPSLSVEEAAQAFAAVGSEARMQVVLTLVRAGEPGLTVGAIQQRLEIPASTLAHHLRFLVASGLVRQDRQGREIINRADFTRIRHVAQFLLSECCKDTEDAPL